MARLHTHIVEIAVYLWAAVVWTGICMGHVVLFKGKNYLLKPLATCVHCSSWL